MGDDSRRPWRVAARSASEVPIVIAAAGAVRRSEPWTPTRFRARRAALDRRRPRLRAASSPGLLRARRGVDPVVAGRRAEGRRRRRRRAGPPGAGSGERPRPRADPRRPARLRRGRADRLWYPIWDAGIALDHSVRTPKEAVAVAGDDLKVVLSLLDGRTDRGRLRPRRQAAAIRCANGGSSGAKKRLAGLEEITRERHVKEGDVAHLLEPDLKQAKGGLRDLRGPARARAWPRPSSSRSSSSPTAPARSCSRCASSCTGSRGGQRTGCCSSTRTTSRRGSATVTQTC